MPVAPIFILRPQKMRILADFGLDKNMDFPQNRTNRVSEFSEPFTLVNGQEATPENKHIDSHPNLYQALVLGENCSLCRTFPSAQPRISVTSKHKKSLCVSQNINAQLTCALAIVTKSLLQSMAMGVFINDVTLESCFKYHRPNPIPSGLYCLDKK